MQPHTRLGFTIANIDEVFAPYAENTFNELKSEGYSHSESCKILKKIIFKKVKSLQYKIECVNNANGQTAFLTWTLGLGTNFFERLITETILDVREKYFAIFPKLIYLYVSEVSGDGAINDYLYKKSIRVSMKQMYPDYLSGECGVQREVYDRTKQMISMMGCRAQLSPYYDENGVERYVGRFNLGAVSLNIPRYAIESNRDKNAFFNILEKYINYASEIHKYTYEKMRKVKGKTNPLLFCEGGCIDSVGYNETIEKCIKSCTYSFGYIGLEEASYYMTGKHLHEDNSFACEILDFINTKIDELKNKTGLAYALYGTPSESMCHKLCIADRDKFGEIEGVTDKKYYENSFHVGSRFSLNAFEKQDIEAKLYHKSNGGHISYCEFEMVDNFKAFKKVIDNAMKLGLYFEINFEKGLCEDCNHEGNMSSGKCPKCGSSNVSIASRVCGYLGYKKKEGQTRLNEGKLDETNAREKHFGIFK